MDLHLTDDYLENITPDTIVDYGAICEALKKWETEPHTDLLETLTQKATQIVFSYKTVKSARIHIRKPDIIAQAQAVGVEVFVARPQKP